MNAKKIALAIALAAAGPLSLYAQDGAHLRMDGVTRYFQRQGFAITSEHYSGDLRNGRIAEGNVVLSASDDQMVAAVCDGDCGDLDISLFEMDGREIASDRDDDPNPVMQVPAGHGGAHRLRVSMANCRFEPCRYEVAVFAR